MSTFDTEPRDYALELVEECAVDAKHLLLCCLKYMSHDDVRDMLHSNELAPCFDEDEDEDDEYELTDEDEVRDVFWSDHPEWSDERDYTKSQNDYRADIRVAFVDWLDQSHREGRLSDDLASSVTLGDAEDTGH